MYLRLKKTVLEVTYNTHYFRVGLFNNSEGLLSKGLKRQLVFCCNVGIRSKRRHMWKSRTDGSFLLRSVFITASDFSIHLWPTSLGNSWKIFIPVSHSVYTYFVLILKWQQVLAATSATHHVFVGATWASNEQMSLWRLYSNRVNIATASACWLSFRWK